MASPQEDGGEYFFCLRGALLWRTLVMGVGVGGICGECCFLVLRAGDHPRFSSLHPSGGIHASS